MIAKTLKQINAISPCRSFASMFHLVGGMFISLNETASDHSELLIIQKQQFGSKEASCAEEQEKDQRIMYRRRLRMRRKRRNQNLLRRRGTPAQQLTCLHLEITIYSLEHTHVPTVKENMVGMSLRDHPSPALLLPLTSPLSSW